MCGNFYRLEFQSTIDAKLIHAGRPLISLTCAELGMFHRFSVSIELTVSGTEETRIEATLGIYFMLAKAWDAIIVIDEADVYVEGRGMDFKRGNLVAGKQCSITCHYMLLPYLTPLELSFDPWRLSGMSITVESFS